jgi:SulP family sulfate permease
MPHPEGTAGHGAEAPLPEEESRLWAEEMRAMGSAWVTTWKDVLSFKHTGADLAAGLTVGAVALPLNLALAVASGLPPSAGLLAGVVGGGVAALLGGSVLQVTGPAAALSTMVLALVAKFGAAGAAAAALCVGLVQVVLSIATAGRLARLVPESVLAGFTTGVGVKLLDNQIPELLGFDYKVSELVEMMHRPHWLHDVSWLAVVCGLGVAMLVTTTKAYKRFPAALVGISVVTFLAVYLGWDIERVGAVPDRMPAPAWPDFADEQWPELFVAAFPVALLAAVESLLSARVVDRMVPTAKPHNSNLELLGQGVANMAVSLFGGMPVTGVVVRSSVNVQSGGRTRLSSVVHALVLLSGVVVFSDQIRQVPLAALAGLLCVIGTRLIEVGTFVHLVRTERLEALAFAVTLAGTVSGHLMVGLGAGLAIHAAGRWMAPRAQEGLDPVLKQRGIRAVLSAGQHDDARRPAIFEPPPDATEWFANIRARPTIPHTAFVHRQAAVIGNVVLGEDVHIAAGSSVRADEGSPFFIGAHSNVQDGVVIHALKGRRVRVGSEEWAVYVGREVSMAHDALVHGPCYIGDHTFIGFKAVVHDSVVGSHCYIGIGAVVVGVEIPDGRYVPHGFIVDTAEKAAGLPMATDTHHEFNEDVVDVNRGLASAYHRHAEEHAPHEHRHHLASRHVQGSALVHRPTHAPRGRVQSWEEDWVPDPGGPDRF